jgi:transcriptional regulator GlxA family with amidase domain
MTGWRVFPWQQQKAIGMAVHTARQASPPAAWKELARKYGRSQRQLERYEQAAVGAGIADLFERRRRR